MRRVRIIRIGRTPIEHMATIRASPMEQFEEAGPQEKTHVATLS